MIRYGRLTSAQWRDGQQYPAGDWRPMYQTASKSLLRFSLGRQANIWVTKNLKNKNHARVSFHPLPGRPHWGTRFEFWHAGWYRWRNHPCQILSNRFRGFGLLIPPILPFFIGIAGRKCSVSTTKLHCDTRDQRRILGDHKFRFWPLVVGIR